MSYVAQACFTVICDECGGQDDGGDYTPHFDSHEDADQYLRATDWFIEGPDDSRKHYCLTCGCARLGHPLQGPMGPKSQHRWCHCAERREELSVT